MENNVVAHFVAVLTLMLNVNGPLRCVYIAQLRFLCDADVDTDSCTEKVTMNVTEIAPRSVLNGLTTHLSWPRSQSRSSGITYEHYH